MKPRYKNETERKKWIQTLHPYEAVWEFTLGCNMRCLHCGSSASPLTRRLDELSTKEGVMLLCDLKEIGLQRISFGGGEPFLRKDWEYLAQTAYNLRIEPGFISNGFLFDAQLVKKLKKFARAGFALSLSLDGDRQIHDYIRQKKGSFARVTQALRLLQDNGVPASIITQVNRLNLNKLQDIRDHIFKFNIYGWKIQVSFPFGRMSENKDFCLSSQEYASLIDFAVVQKKQYGNKVSISDCIGYYTQAEKVFRPRHPWAGCHAGISNIGITSNGGITGCLSMQDKHFIEGNIRKRSLKDIWYDPKSFSYNRNFKEKYLQGYCSLCRYGERCQGGCKSIAYSFSGRLYDNFYCIHRIRNQKDTALSKIRLRKRNANPNLHP